MKKENHIVKSVIPGGIAEEMEIEAGDKIISIDGTEITDIFDYQYLCQNTYIEVLVEKPDGEQWILEVDKEFDEDLGIIFENGLMDEYRSCCNKCVFCFIDQMPPGMRPTLYFKDDDSRLSFLQGNYVTLTNMSDADVDRIIRYRLSPINVSIHSMNPELRVKLLHNRFAGEALKKIDRLAEAGIEMNGQIVLCKDLNDGAELEFSIQEMMKYIPNLVSVSVVPVGLTKYRDGLEPLKSFDKESAGEVIDLIEKYQKICFEQHGIHFIHASDEWYILAEREFPEEGRYDGYLQYENGVGMCRMLIKEYDQALERLKKQVTDGARKIVPNRCTIATGRLVAPVLTKLMEKLMEAFPEIEVSVLAIRNDFFGEKITVSGLLTGQDILAQLLEYQEQHSLGEYVLLPQNVLRSGEDVFLDDMTKGELESALQLPALIVKSSGYDLLTAVLGE